MQQLLPFTVLKLEIDVANATPSHVATALTVYGIETATCSVFNNQMLLVATALTVYGIETKMVLKITYKP